MKCGSCRRVATGCLTEGIDGYLYLLWGPGWLALQDLPGKPAERKHPHPSNAESSRDKSPREAEKGHDLRAQDPPNPESAAPRLFYEVFLRRIPVYQQLSALSFDPPFVALRLDCEETRRPEDDVIHVPDPGQ